MSMTPTEEQIAICASNAEVLKIKAGAGTGKTTTLRALAGRHRDKRILYLAFNKAIKEEAQGKFVPNVKAMTAHGLAFSRVGKDYANQPNKLLSGDLKPFHVLPLLGVTRRSIPAPAQNLYGGRVIETLKAFLVSPDMELREEHVVLGHSPVENKHFSAQTILADAGQLWQQMSDLRSSVPITHDGYLKLFQLSLPALPYDMIMLDEAQDTNPVTQGLVEIQAARKVYVGDEHQAIYGFRGARNAMALIEANEEHFLTGSFRFGPEIAAVANAILAAKGENMRLKGLGSPSQLGIIGSTQAHAYISRGNASLFARAVQALENKEAFAFVGPIYNYRFDLIEQTYHLFNKRSVSDPFLKTFTNYEQLEEYAKDMVDREIMSRCGLVNKYTHRIPGLVARIAAQAKSYPADGPANLILSSGHRCKGLEFERVRLADDFMDFFEEDSGLPRDLIQAGERETEEVNLQYVASTRAMRHLEPNPKLQNLLSYQSRKKARAATPALALTP